MPGQSSGKPAGSRRVPAGAASLVEPGAPVVPAAERGEGARLDPLHVVGGRIDDVDVRPDDVAALVVLDLLQLAELVLGGLLVRSALRLADQLVVRGLAP